MNIEKEKSSITKYLTNYTCPNCGNDDYRNLNVMFNSGHPHWKSDFIVNCKKCDNNYGLEIKNEIQNLETDYDILEKSKTKYFSKIKDIKKHDEIEGIQKNINSILDFLYDIDYEIKFYHETKNISTNTKNVNLARKIERNFNISIVEREKNINLKKIDNLKKRYLNHNDYDKDEMLDNNSNNWLIKFARESIDFNSFFNLLNVFIFFIISITVFSFFINQITIFNISFDLNKIYQGNLSKYQYLYLNYYPAVSISLSLFLFYRFFVGFLFNNLKLSIFSKEYYEFIFVKWKIITFLISISLLYLLTTIELVDYGYLTINRFGSTFLIFLCFLTFFTAPWSVGNLIRYFFSLNSNLNVKFPFISLILLFFASSWFYDFYFLLFKQGTYPVTWFYNLTRSVPIYICAGLFWNLSYNFSIKKIKFAFLSKKTSWFGKKDTYFYKSNVNFFIFITRFFPFSLPILLVFFFFIFNSVNFYKILTFTEIVLKDGKQITQITFNFNKPNHPKEINPNNILTSSALNKNNDIVNKNINLFLGDYHALVIGINNYNLSLGKLNTPTKDANVISSILQNKYNFEVKTLINPTRAEIIQSIEYYRENLSFNDNLLIYYAGHGVLDKEGDEGYWQPVDASLSSQTKWISNSWIKSQLNAIDAKHIILIADSCFSAAIFKGNNEETEVPDNQDNQFLIKIAKIPTRKALTAGGLEPVLDGGGSGHSVFAKALITILNDNEDYLIGSNLYTEISKYMAHNAEQTPVYEIIDKTGHVMGGDFIFVPKFLN